MFAGVSKSCKGPGSHLAVIDSTPCDQRSFCRMLFSISPERREPGFPGQLPSKLVAQEVLEGGTLYLQRNELKVVELGHTATTHSTALHVPSIGLVIAGAG